MKALGATNAYWLMWPKITKYGLGPKGVTNIYNVTTLTTTTGVYPNIPRALFTDPIYGHTAGGKAYATHLSGSSMSFNLAYADGSVQTATIKSSIELPNTGNYAQFLSAVQYLETVVGGTGAPPKYVYGDGAFSGIPHD